MGQLYVKFLMQSLPPQQETVQHQRQTDRGRRISPPKVAIIVLFAAVIIFVGYRQVVFQMACDELAGEMVFESRSNVEGLLIADAPAWDSNWTNWLVDKGGYGFVDSARKNTRSVVLGYERVFWHNKGIIGQSGVTQVNSSTADYVIKVSRTFPKSYIAKWEFEAQDRTNGKILGKKVILFSQALIFSQSCPRVASSPHAGKDIFDFFAKQVLIPKVR